MIEDNRRGMVSLVQYSPESVGGKRQAPMVPSNARIEPMRSEMVPEVVKIHLAAFGGYLSSRLGNSYLTAFISWFIHRRGTVALVAIDSCGKMCGYLIAAPVGYGKSLNSELLWVAARSIIWRPWLLFRKAARQVVISRLRLLLGVTTKEQQNLLPKPIMSLVAIGVSPWLRGKKVGSYLMQDFEGRCRDLGVRSLQLSVLPDNGVARVFYETLGWNAALDSDEKNGTMRYYRILDDVGQDKPKA